MTTYTEEIAKHVEQANIGLIVGDNFHIDHLVPETTDCTILYTDGGTQQDMYLDTRYQTISFWARNKRGEDAVAQLEKVLSVLHRLDNIHLGQYYLYFCWATSGILALDTDTRRRRVYKLSFNTIYRDKNVIS